MTNQQLEAVIAKQEELKITDFLKGKFKYDNYGQYIWLVEPNGNHQKIADIRGWGRIQHFFMDKKGKLDTKKAGEFQDKCGEWVVNALNKALESELSALQSIKQEEQPRKESWRDFTMTDKIECQHFNCIKENNYKKCIDCGAIINSYNTKNGIE